MGQYLQQVWGALCLQKQETRTMTRKTHAVMLEGLPSQTVMCQNSCICIGGLSRDSRQEECQLESLTL